MSRVSRGQAALSVTITQTDSCREGGGLLITCKQVAKWKKRIVRASVSPATLLQYWLLLIKGFSQLDDGHARSPAIGKPPWRSLITELIWMFLLRRFGMPAYSWGAHSPLLLSFAGEADFTWMTATLSEPDRSDNYHFLKTDGLCRFSTVKHRIKKKKKKEKKKGHDLENENHKKTKTNEPRNWARAMEGGRIINPLFGLRLINKPYFIYLLLPDLIDRSAMFSWIISLPVNMCTTTLPLYNKKKKHDFFLLSVL